MATALDRAIDALSDPSVSAADALRRLLVVARRIDADALAVWVRQELEGYSAETVPDYRDGSGLQIVVRFDGPGGASMPQRLSAAELTPELGSVMTDFALGMPLAEIEALASGSGDSEPRTMLPAVWLVLYRRAAAEGRVPHMPMFVANSASVEVPRTYLRGLLDRVKTVALDMALGIEDASGDAGEAGGPTVGSEPALEQAVTTHMTMIFANRSTVSVASGEGATAVQLEVGDRDGLLAAAASLVAGPGVEDLDEALTSDGGTPGEATQGFLARLRSGGIALVAGVTTSAAYDGIKLLLDQAYPGS